MNKYIYIIVYLYTYIQIKQRLWPQCQSCFQIQGSAVRTNKHVIIYHNYPKLHHLTPAIIYMLLSNKEIKKHIDNFYVNMDNYIDDVNDRFKIYDNYLILEKKISKFMK
jgi:hypothetical protein